MNKKNLIFIVIGIVIIILFFYFSDIFEKNIEKKYLYDSIIEIQCEVDSDCILTYDIVSFCQPQQSINKNFFINEKDKIKKYNEEIELEIKNAGEYHCKYAFTFDIPKCSNNICSGIQ